MMFRTIVFALIFFYWGIPLLIYLFGGMLMLLSKRQTRAVILGIILVCAIF